MAKVVFLSITTQNFMTQHCYCFYSHFRTFLITILLLLLLAVN